ncbi:MAG TPA: S41 family peptidase [Candidatus Saccharimonadales bacterium]|nr:S41 family peptidase [Candidatus Saccharimonadales bacterium]
MEFIKKTLKRFWPKQKKQIKEVSVLLIYGVALFILGINVGSGWIQNRVDEVLHKNDQTSNLPNSLNLSAIQQEYQDIKDNYDGKLTVSQLEDGIAHGLANATGDPYTEYFDPSEAQAFNNDLNSTFSGIGAGLDKDSSGNLIVQEVLSDTPAQRAGLKVNDVITSINGTSTTNINVDTAVTDIRGAAGTIVKLDVLRGGSQVLNFSIKRAVIKVPSVNSKIIDGNIGYMQITTFGNDTSSLAQTAANMFKQKDVKGVILDLRGNGGGLVTAAINVSSLWLEPGATIFTEKHDNQVVATNTANGNDPLIGIPTVVLIDGDSASASEITAGALHDNKAAYLIGEKSFGKGSEQTIDNLPGGAEIKVTIAHWYTPGDKNINKIGITPNEVVSLPSNSTTDTQENAAILYLQSKF